MSRASYFLRYTNFVSNLITSTCVCVFVGKGKGGGAPNMHGHKKSYRDLNLKMLISEWDSNPRPHTSLTLYQLS